MTSVQLPLIFPITTNEWFSFALGFLFACGLFVFFIHDVKPKQTISRIGVIGAVVVIVLLATFWRPA
jgi:hypothetical protein